MLVLFVLGLALPTHHIDNLSPYHKLRDDPLPAPQFFTQRQDHFDGSNPATWQQAYYVNAAYWKGASSGAPVFICVGGEGPPLDGSVVVASVHCNEAVEWLPQTGALMFALEHRYYGCHNSSACPVTDFTSTTSLRYLSSRQALADLAAFHEFATTQYKLTAANKWVSFGGSYPGMLSAWFRLKFPHLVHASVSSSAPVKAQVDMVGYNDVVGEAYNVTTAGGSPACYNAIFTGHSSILSLMNGTPANRSHLISLFKLPITPSAFDSIEFQRNFAGYGVFPFPAQSNDPACEEALCNIEKICQVMTNPAYGTDGLERLAYLYTNQAESQRKEHLELTTASQRLRVSVDQMSDKLQDLPDFWGYQTCTEFAFYQTCEVGSKCMFAQGLVTLDHEMSFCKESFGIDTATVYENVDFSNVYYGADHPSGSRVLWVNGDIDPWHALAVLNVTSSSQQAALWVPGASHHFWTHPSLPTDSPAVVKARALIRQQLTAWLSEDE